MSAGQRRSRSLQHEKATEVVSGVLDGEQVKRALATVRDIFQSAYGPTGRLKFFQNSAGGHVTLTSSSRRVIESLLSNSHPVVRLVLTAVKGHLDNYFDGGLQTALLVFSLIESSQRLPVPRHLVTELNEHALNRIIQHLEADNCRWRMQVDFGDMKSMLAVVNSTLNTKPACHLHDDEKKFLSVLLVKAFAQSLPSSSAGNRVTPFPVQIMTCEGSPIQESRIYDGVLLEAPELNNLAMNYEVLGPEPLKVALFDISMAGDTQEWFEGIDTEATASAGHVDVTEGVLKQMLQVVDKLVSLGVKVVACQRCMHPALKEYLKDRDVFVVDRLSILHIGAVQRLTGATILSTFSRDVPASCCGSVQKIKHLMMNNKSYLQLLPASPPEAPPSVSTLLLCSSDEASIEELKLVCQAAIGTLHGIVHSPYVVPGGGCLDTHLASLLRHCSLVCGNEVTRQFCCSKAQFRMVINSIAKCLETQARSLEHDGDDHVTDSIFSHHWTTSSGSRQLCPRQDKCNCGLVSRNHEEMGWSMMGECDFAEHFSCARDQSERRFSEAVLDSYPMKLNALKTAFETANIVLRIHYLVGEKSQTQ